MIGKRRDGVKPLELEPGDYAVDETGVWACLPEGERIRIDTSPEGDWKRIEHEDGSLSIQPSISIPAIPGQYAGWHGWLRAGEWVTA